MKDTLETKFNPTCEKNLKSVLLFPNADRIVSSFVANFAWCTGVGSKGIT